MTISTRTRTAHHHGGGGGGGGGGLTSHFHCTKPSTNTQHRGRGPALSKGAKGVKKADPPVDAENTAPPTKKRRTTTAKEPKTKTEAADADPPLPILSEEEIKHHTTALLPSLTFDLEAGKRHLVSADPRFTSLVKRIPMRIFEELDNSGKELDLFKTLVTSILGQQVSWLAARAILYKFVRLWFPHLPPTPDFQAIPREKLPFPTPLQVRAATPELLRSAGLSGQKVKYVSDIAARFSDGRLDIRKILTMKEQDVVQELVKIKGVGVWTAQMLLIFALRRPDVLPVGDLGVQRGVILLWASGSSGPAIKSAKARPADEGEGDADIDARAHQDAREAQKVEEAVELAEGQHPEVVQGLGVDAAAADDAAPVLSRIPSLPADANMTPAQLNARKSGTKTKGKQYLTPEEMEALCETWKPYRSLASVIMWGLVDA